MTTLSRYQHKVFIISLPRTGTTSLSVALLNHGFNVAHQAFTQHSFELADVVSDAPCFSDYQQLDKLFPKAKFIYLQRPIDDWVASMQMLLGKMLPQLTAAQSKFHPILLRSFEHTFAISQTDNPQSSQHLAQCYKQHLQQVNDYFKHRSSLLKVDLTEPDCLQRILAFLSVPQQHLHLSELPHLNRHTHVASWDEYQHSNKISSHAFGPLRRKFFDYSL